VNSGPCGSCFAPTTPPEHAIQTCDGVYLSADRKLLLQLLAANKPWTVCDLRRPRRLGTGQHRAEIGANWILKREIQGAISARADPVPSRRGRRRSAEPSMGLSRPSSWSSSFRSANSRTPSQSGSHARRRGCAETGTTRTRFTGPRRHLVAHCARRLRSKETRRQESRRPVDG